MIGAGDRGRAVNAGRAVEADVGSAVEVFSGVGVALVTFFDRAGDVDPAATAAHAADLVARGMRAVLVAGTTGEAGQLTAAERVALIRAVRAALPAEVPVLAGTGAASTEAAVELTPAARLGQPARFLRRRRRSRVEPARPGLPRAVDLRPWRAGGRTARSPGRRD